MHMATAYYVFNRRSELGRSIGSTWGNANNWAYSAKELDLPLIILQQ